MSIIRFETKPYKIGSWLIIRLPKDISLKLPFRTLTMISGTINDHPFKTAFEPDGKGSHWFRVDETLQKIARIKVGNNVTFEIEPTKEWIEPEVPKDLKEALSTSKKAEDLWRDITPNARWDWIRWIRAVKTQETRKKHIRVAISKLNKGMRRPCCFNRNLCSEPYVSKNWVLLDPTVTFTTL